MHNIFQHIVRLIELMTKKEIRCLFRSRYKCVKKNKYLCVIYKMSKIILKDYQRLPVRYIKDNYGLVLYHSTGSGKTVTALASMLQFDRDIIIIGPKSSKKIFTDEIKKYEIDNTKIKMITYQKIKNILQDKIDLFRDKCVIIDEAHHLRTETMNNMFITSALTLAYRVILLTATPVINYLNDIAILVNIVKKTSSLPTERQLFNHIYFDEYNLELKNENLMKEKLRNVFSYYENKESSSYPKYKTHYEKITMNKSQVEEYSKFVYKILIDKTNIYDLDNIFNINFNTLKPGKRNAFLTATRQISNTVKNDPESPKIKAIFTKIKTGPYPVVVYSNFLENGIYALSLLLEKNNIGYKTITGNTTDDKINVTVNDYNNGKITVLLLSSAGSESLDLKNTRQIHVMEPHWNESKIQQVVGRAIRYNSHVNLSEKERFVDVYRWFSIFPDPIKNDSADQYLISISQKKKEIWKKFKDIIISESIEKN